MTSQPPATVKRLSALSSLPVGRVQAQQVDMGSHQNLFDVDSHRNLDCRQKIQLPALFLLLLGLTMYLCFGRLALQRTTTG